MPRKLSLLEQRKVEARVLVPIIQAFEKEFGKERAHAIVRKVVADLARKTGEEFAREGGSGNAPDPIGKVKELVPVFSGDEALEIDVVESSGDAYDFNVTRCRFAEFYKEMRVPELGFVLSCNRDFSLSEGVSSDLELKRTQTIMEGASHCDFRFRLRKEQGSQQEKNRARSSETSKKRKT